MMTIHQPMYDLDQQVLNELYTTWIVAGIFIIACAVTLFVISKKVRNKRWQKIKSKLTLKL